MPTCLAIPTNNIPLNLFGHQLLLSNSYPFKYFPNTHIHIYLFLYRILVFPTHNPTFLKKRRYLYLSQFTCFFKTKIFNSLPICSCCHIIRSLLKIKFNIWIFFLTERKRKKYSEIKWIEVEERWEQNWHDNLKKDKFKYAFL